MRFSDLAPARTISAFIIERVYDLVADGLLSVYVVIVTLAVRLSFFPRKMSCWCDAEGAVRKKA